MVSRGSPSRSVREEYGAYLSLVLFDYIVRRNVVLLTEIPVYVICDGVLALVRHLYRALNALSFAQSSLPRGITV